jgi:hypothetical protein
MSLDVRLSGPVRKIAELAVSRTGYYGEADLDLFDLRMVIRTAKTEIVETLREEVERLTHGAQTVRELDGRLVRQLLGLGHVYCVMCPADTPQGRVDTPGDGMFAFAVTGSSHGYIPLHFK